MNAEQRDVVDAVLHHGRNVFFHGAAGTGADRSSCTLW